VLSQSLAQIYRDGGAWSEVYLDVTVHTPDVRQVKDERRASVLDQLERAGAPKADIDTIGNVLAADEIPRGSACIFLLVKDGELVIHERIPGLAVEPGSVSFGPLPSLLPVLSHQPWEFSYLVVETAREGGEVRLYRAGSAKEETEEHVEGRTGTLHKIPGGGWRHDHIQNHVEEIWRQNQSKLATVIDEIVRARRPRLLVVAGDIRARELLQKRLSAGSKEILSVEPTDTRADGASDHALVEHVNREIERIMADDKRDISDRLAMRSGRGDKTTEFTLGGVVDALAGAQVDILILDSERLRDRELLALDAEPWIATAPEATHGASIIASAPAELGLVRAALLTDARILFTDSGGTPDGRHTIALPENAPAGALLRWHTGPPVRGS
jgi:hypothetical protein